MFMHDRKQQPAKRYERDLDKQLMKANQDKKYNSMKHLKGQQFLFTKTYIRAYIHFFIVF